jgi:hypothetical protein
MSNLESRNSSSLDCMKGLHVNAVSHRITIGRRKENNGRVKNVVFE